MTAEALPESVSRESCMSEDTPSTPSSDSNPRALKKQASPVGTSGPVVLPAVPAESGRNLAIGVFLVLAALPVAGVACIWAPREAFVAISTAMLIALLVFLFFQLRLITQRNGTFALLAAGLLVTLTVPVLIKVGASTSELAEWFLSVRQPHPANEPRIAGLPEASPGVPRPLPESSQRPQPPQTAPISPVSPVSPALTSVVLGLPDASSSPASTAQEPGSARGAEGVSSRQKGGSETQATPPDSEETVVQRTTRMAKEEALKRYPNLGRVGSVEHSAYIQTFNEFERLHKHDFFADPKWPLNLAELLAKRYSWKKGNAEDGRFSAAVPPQEDGVPRATVPVIAPQTQGTVASAADASPSPGPQTEAGGEPEFIGKLFGLDLPEADPANPNRTVVSEALAEVKKRYPTVAQAGSAENRLFVEAYREYDRLRPDFFQNPRWPLRLVDLVAKQEGWNRAPVPSAASQER